MAQVIELRAYQRKPGNGLVAQIGEELVPVIDISPAGIRMALPSIPLAGRNVDFQIMPVSGTAPEFYRAVPVRGHVVGESGDHVRIAFATANRALAGLVGQFESKGVWTWEPSSQPVAALIGPR